MRSEQNLTDPYPREQMKRRHFLSVGASVAGIFLFGSWHRGNRRAAERLSEAKRLAIDPSGESFVYVDGWITDVRS